MEPTHITLNNTNVHKVEKFKNYINDYLNYTKVNDKAKQVQFNKLMNFFLYHGTGVEDVTISECQGYFNYLDRVSNYNGISSNTMMKKKALIIK